MSVFVFGSLWGLSESSLLVCVNVCVNVHACLRMRACVSMCRYARLWDPVCKGVFL